MIRQYDIVKILKKVVSEMLITIKVKAFTDNLDGTFTIETCNTQYLNSCSYFKVNGNSYLTQSFEGDTTVTIKGTPALDSDFNLDPPFFVADTPSGANSNLLGKRSDLSRLPFIWLLEDFPTNYELTRSVVVSPRLKLFFMNTNKEAEWLEGVHRKECIQPMVNLCDKFLIDVQRKVSGKLDKFTTKNRLKFGKYLDNKGNVSKIIEENLSGVELDIEIPIKKWAVGCNEC